MGFASHDDYMAQVSPQGQQALLCIQQTVERLLPQAQRCVGYQMPAYRLQRIFFYFAAFKKHIGVYPPLHLPALAPGAVSDPYLADLMDQLKPYRGPKGNLSFLYQDGVPTELIGRVALALAAQYHPDLAHTLDNPRPTP
jgi:uncharacterized protein YdhG (YjbR/CyaY superfamily)